MKQQVITIWKGEMAFESEVNGHFIVMDADETVGGSNKGPRPKSLLLSAIAGCTGMDIVSILKKMQVADYQLEISVEGDVAEEHPKVFTAIRILFTFTGNNLPEDKIARAVSLSQEKYCSVSAMLSKACPITYSIEYKR